VSTKQKTGLKQTAYLSKRILQQASRKAFQSASVRAMKTMGYLIKAENGWLIRENADGSVEKISKLASVKRPSKIILD
jgi:hypothetical protein